MYNKAQAAYPSIFNIIQKEKRFTSTARLERELGAVHRVVMEGEAHWRKFSPVFNI
jgi:hypothetical protein